MMSDKEMQPLTEWADERASAVHEENQDIARSNRLLRAKLREREEDLAEVQKRLTAYEHPFAHRVERLVTKRASITREEIAKEVGCSLNEADAILVDLSARGYNVVDGVISKVAGGARPTVEHFYGDIVRFGVVSDTHIGNHHAMEEELHEAYAVFETEGIETVYVPGNLIDGEKTYAGQEYEINVMGVDNVVSNLARVWPRVDGITTYHVASSTCHEGYYLKSAGVLIGKQIEAERPDMVYLGLDEADVIVHPGERRPRLRIVHPGGGSSYADSYRPQKIVESYSGGDKPDILAIGHYHKGGYYNIRDVAVLQAMCLERQTPFMRKRSLRAVLGFWVVEARFTPEGSLQRFKPEEFRYYLDEHGKVIKRWSV
jgi:predicted phosphodiesterase